MVLLEPSVIIMDTHAEGAAKGGRAEGALKKKSDFDRTAIGIWKTGAFHRILFEM